MVEKFAYNERNEGIKGREFYRIDMNLDIFTSDFNSNSNSRCMTCKTEEKPLYKIKALAMVKQCLRLYFLRMVLDMHR